VYVSAILPDCIATTRAASRRLGLAAHANSWRATGLAGIVPGRHGGTTGRLHAAGEVIGTDREPVVVVEAVRAANVELAYLDDLGAHFAEA